MKIYTDNRGFTLIELMVAMVISIFVMAAIYTLFRSSSEIFTSQEQLVEVHQNIRAVLNIMTRNIRMAGFNPNRNATNATIIYANATSLRIAYDGENLTVDDDVEFNYSSTDNSMKYKSYGTNGNDSGNQRFAEDISSLVFTYTLSDGSTTSSPSKPSMIRMVGIQICGKISGSYSEKYDSLQCVNSTVRCRNMGLE